MICSIDLKKIDDYMKREKTSKRETARRMGIDNGYLVRVLNGEKSPGMKFMQGLLKLGYKSNEIFIEEDWVEESIDSKAIDRYILEYMNTSVMKFNKEYTLDDLIKIKKSVLIERADRKKKCINIKPSTNEGRLFINKRIVDIAKKHFNIELKRRDIEIFKRCQQQEVRDRRLINSFDKEEVLYG